MVETIGKETSELIFRHFFYSHWHRIDLWENIPSVYFIAVLWTQSLKNYKNLSYSKGEIGFFTMMNPMFRTKAAWLINVKTYISSERVKRLSIFDMIDRNNHFLFFLYKHVFCCFLIISMAFQLRIRLRWIKLRFRLCEPHCFVRSIGVRY